MPRERPMKIAGYGKAELTNNNSPHEVQMRLGMKLPRVAVEPPGNAARFLQTQDHTEQRGECLWSSEKPAVQEAVLWTEFYRPIHNPSTFMY